MMSLLKKSIVFACWASLATPTLAIKAPKPGLFDSRITYINHNPDDIVQIIGHFGYSTHVKFSPDESILQIAMGDPDAWDIVPVKNHIFLKPVADNALTNMTVITSSRIYNFELDAKWPDDKNEEMVFQVNFKYPQFDKKKKLALKGQEQKNKEQSKIKSFLNHSLSSMNRAHPRNWNYWFKGSDEVTPDLMFDDGRFTYVKFANNREMPAIYTVNDDGSESLVNTHINPHYPDIITIHKVKKRFTFRKGKAVACIFNKSFDSRGIGIPTGTTSPEVIRTIKNHLKD
jgi:type IV secretion system protein VirB9